MAKVNQHPSFVHACDDINRMNSKHEKCVLVTNLVIIGQKQILISHQGEMKSKWIMITFMNLLVCQATNSEEIGHG